MDLLHAFQSGDIEAVQRVLEDIRPTIYHGINDLLVEATKAGNIEMMELLVNYGAKVNFRSSVNGITPLDATFSIDSIYPHKLGDDERRKKILETIGWLVKQGADINSGVLISAIYQERDALQFVEYFINQGVDLNNSYYSVDDDFFRDTAIGAAVHVNNAEIVLLLIENGADPSGGDSAAAYSPREEALEIQESLKKEMLNIHAHLQENKEMIEMLSEDKRT